MALRLAAHNFDLSPTKFAWAKMKRFITYSNIGVKFSLHRVRRLTHEEIQRVTNWHLRTTEEIYYTKNGIFSEMIDKRGFKLKEVNRI